ncbi:MAG: S8 family serine peptidase [Bryobacteraceae bacterium]
MRTTLVLLLSLALFSGEALAAGRGARFALILEDPPLAMAQSGGKTRAAIADQKQKIAAAQTTLRQALAEKRFAVTASTDTLLNAVYVAGSEDDAEALAAMPGVARVVRLEPVRRQLITAIEQIRAPEAWAILGGESNAGAGVRIAVLDSGIDQEHAAFQDPALSAPAGYPRCQGSDCAFTNNKVIAARSYVDILVLGDQPEFSRPDDLSPRDRVGHGTAVASVAAGVRHVSPLGMMSGVAPKAFLGNYKIFGSPGVNDVTFDDAIITALEDAIGDGMQIAVLSLGTPAIWAPTDRGGICDLAGNAPCDPRAAAVQAASQIGLTVVVAAGNDGDLGVVSQPALNSVHSPGTAVAALTVGAITNSQRYFSTVSITGPALPEALREIRTLFGNGPRPNPSLRAPVRDLAAVQDSGSACEPLATGSLAGAIALVQRGNCSFTAKVQNAQRAGAVAVLVQQTDGSDFLFPMTNLEETGIPAALIGSTAGKALQLYLTANPDAPATMDPTLRAFPFDPGYVAYFSSYGPSIEGGEIKPEVAAVGHPVYMATQRFDPNGDMYSPNGYSDNIGTSFSAPMAAGAAAMFKQRFTDSTAAQTKSAVVNTAINDLRDVDETGREIRASVLGVGAGRIQANEVARTNLTVEPSTISIGYLPAGATFPLSGSIRINNHSAESVNLTLEVQEATNTPSARITLAETAFALAGRQSRLVTVRLEGSRPQPGIYEGAVVIAGGASPLRVPYLFLVGDGAPANIVPLRGYTFSGDTGGRERLAFKIIDRFGVPVADVPVQFRATLGDGRIDTALARTDELGIADASVVLGPRVGAQEFTAEAGGMTIAFQGRARVTPSVATNGVVNAASNQIGRGVAPGSYAAIYGRDLSESFRAATTASLPLSLAGVSVSFDVPARRISVPGRLHFVSDGQVNVQIPWELQGLNSAVMKVSIENSSSALFTVQLNDYSPALFEIPDPSGRQIAAALDGQFRLVTTSNAPGPGGTVQLYGNGLGPVTNTPASGEPSSADPLSQCTTTPQVTVGGRPAEVLFCGLAPFNVGLYQLNLRLAADTPSGVQPVAITTAGVEAKVVSLPVQ